ncbi:terminase large subunit [Brevundimonas sp. 2R-24]|uniref:Terminase large subunit n=1 Tax=Peiella sedimenti TaxID=3061083 RepID=A0ABT8SML8_9CAUL|nr:terminase large subunit [Caulobacteraceae bacterium XZ-24]
MAEVARNAGRAQRVIDFIEKLSLAPGVPFKLREWQRKFIRDIYEPIDPERPGKRRTRRAVFSVARKNGKTEIAAAIILAHLIGPEAEYRGQIYSAANDREQAGFVFDVVRKFIDLSPGLREYLTVVPSTKTVFVKRSDVKAAGSKFRALSADAGTKHGLNASLVVYDELAQSKNRELYDTLRTSQGARAEPLFLAISTQSNDPSSVMSELIDFGLSGKDPTTVCHLYAAPEGCDLLDEEAWRAANPALGDFRDIHEIRTLAKEAKALPTAEQNFRLLYLNQRVSQHASLITAADWKACEASFEFEPGEPIYLGLDMSVRTDLTALVAVSALDGSRVKAWFWKPGDYLDEHTTRDRVRYDLFAANNLLFAPEGRSIDPQAVALRVADLVGRYDVRGLAYDRWRIDEFLRCLDAIGLEAQEGEGAGLRLVRWGQGFGDMAPAIDAFEHAVLEGDLQHDGHPLLTFCVMNALAVSDAAGNRKLDKAKSRFRIDGAVALAMALGLKARDRQTAVAVSPWEDPEFSIQVA